MKRVWMSGGDVGGVVCVEVVPKRGTFFRFQLCERTRISQVEVYESVGNGLKGLRDAFYGYEKSRESVLAL